jgi:hypothetical protein
LNEDVRRRGLLAPLHMYPIPGAIIALPYEPSTTFADYMAHAVCGLDARDEFFVVVDKDDGDPWQPWFRRQYASTFRVERLPSKHGAPITRFRRLEITSPGTTSAKPPMATSCRAAWRSWAQFPTTFCGLARLSGRSV